MKKIVSLFVLTFVTAVLFAQNSSYDKLVKKAQEYESKKEWAYALGFYADAIDLQPTNCESAYKRFAEITESIASGNPGMEKVNGIKLYSGWKNLLINTEKYWSEYCPFKITVGKLELKNMSGNTADYGAPIEFVYLKKYMVIMGKIVEGYKKVRVETWDLPDAEFSINYEGNCRTGERYWPCVSVSKPESAKKNSDNFYPLDKNTSNYLTNGVITYSMVPRYRYTTEYGMNDYYNAFAVVQAPSYGWGVFYSLYDLAVKIVDENGRELVPAERLLAKVNNNEQYVLFSNINLNVAEKIDEGKACAVLSGVYLRYGYQNLNDYLEFSEDRTTSVFKRNLSEKNIPLEKVVAINSNNSSVEGFFAGYLNRRYSLTFEDLMDQEEIYYMDDNSIIYYIPTQSSLDMFDSSVRLYKSKGDYETYNIKPYEFTNVVSFLRGVPLCYNSSGKKICDDGYFYNLNGNGWTSSYIRRIHVYTDQEKTDHKELLEDGKKLYREGMEKYNSFCRILESDNEYNATAKKIYSLLISLEKCVDEKYYSGIEEKIKSVREINFADLEADCNNYKKKLSDGEDFYKNRLSEYNEISNVLRGERDWLHTLNICKAEIDDLKKALDKKKVSEVENRIKDFERLQQDFENLKEAKEKKIEENNKKAEEAKKKAEEEKRLANKRATEEASAKKVKRELEDISHVVAEIRTFCDANFKLNSCFHYDIEKAENSVSNLRALFRSSSNEKVASYEGKLEVENYNKIYETQTLYARIIDSNKDIVSKLNDMGLHCQVQPFDATDGVSELKVISVDRNSFASGKFKVGDLIKIKTMEAYSSIMNLKKGDSISFLYNRKGKLLTVTLKVK